MVGLFPLLLLPKAGWAQRPCQWYEPIDCWNRKSIAQLWGEAAGAKVALSEQIAEARAKFWAAYPNKPGFEDAATAFAQLLNDKDLYYLNTYMSVQRMNLPSQPGRAGTPEDAMDRIMGGVKIDNGIPDSAEFAFRQWSRIFKEHLDAAGGVFSPNVVQNMLKAMAESDAAHLQIFGRARLGRVRRGRARSRRLDNPEKYADLLYARFGRMTLEEAQQNVHTMRSIYGDSLVLRAAGEVLRWR